MGEKENNSFRWRCLNYLVCRVSILLRFNTLLEFQQPKKLHNKNTLIIYHNIYTIVRRLT